LKLLLGIRNLDRMRVRPRTGARIETWHHDARSRPARFAPVRGRGLKPCEAKGETSARGSPPYGGAD